MRTLESLRLHLHDSNIAHRCKISYNPSLVVVYFYNKLNKKRYDKQTASPSTQVDPSNVLVLGHRNSELPTPQNSPRCHEKCFQRKKEGNTREI